MVSEKLMSVLESAVKEAATEGKQGNRSAFSVAAMLCYIQAAVVSGTLQDLVRFVGDFQTMQLQKQNPNLKDVGGGFLIET